MGDKQKRKENMKKLLGISLVAVLAVSPLMANAAIPAGETGLAAGATGVNVAAGGAYYAGKSITDADRAATASAAYVKGAYNDAISAVNKVAEQTSNIASNTYSKDQVDAALNGKQDLANSNITQEVADAHSSLTAGANVAGNLASVAGVAEGAAAAIATYGNIVTHNVSEFATAEQGAKANSAVQSVTTGDAQSGNGTIKVDGNAVSVYGLGSAAYTDSTAYDAAGAAAAAQTAAITAAATDATTKANAAQAAAEATAAADATTKANAAEQNAKDYADTAITNLNIGDYATKAGVLATVEAATVTATVPSQSVSGTVPMMIEWGAINADTASVTGSTAGGSITNGEVVAPATYQQGA